MGIFKRHPMIVTGVSITVLFLLLNIIRIGFLDTLELKFFDIRMNLRTAPDSESQIVMVDIDDDSIEKIGRWPWPRDLIAKGVEKINAGKPKVIGLNLILSEPERSPGLAPLKDLQAQFAASMLNATGEDGKRFLSSIEEHIFKLDKDRILAGAIAASGNVVLPIFFKSGISGGSLSAEDTALLKKQIITQVIDPSGYGLPEASDAVLPIMVFFSAASGIGHINLAYDMDGTARRERLLYDFNGMVVPAYTLRLACQFLNVDIKDVKAELGSHIQAGANAIPLTPVSDFLVSFKGPRGSFKRFAYFDVINDKIPPQVFRNKLVLVSASASGIMNPLSTPTDATMPYGEYSAHTIWSILNRQYVNEPQWAGTAELIMILVIGAIITVVLPRLRAVLAGAVFWGLALGLVGGATALFVAEGVWVGTTYPLLQLILGYIGVVSIKYFVTETGKEKVEGESAETNRMLGLSFQNQGMLDMAFDKFRRVPVDDQVKDLLYNLALDYERKRQLNKAASVFEYIESHDPKYKDAATRKRKLMQASETMVFGEGMLGGGGGGDGLLATGTDTRPTLGRYEIIKQLGKGAMGIVYLGQDPRINRTTAIKTFRFGEDFGPEETQKLKEKFFREAESAGTLSHPNIVTIYDAGDEQDLAYIAMEFLEGADLEGYTKKGNLLPIRQVIDHVGNVADALGYAHEKGIVHRDIKPANIMLLKTGVIKITDFGIARITATSQTQTGVVKGTPYYMSPEQFSGEKVDGRSDIFSLGTMLFQMLTGELPFKAESPPALMHQIMNVKHPDPRTLNPKIVKPLVVIIDKALEKDRSKRYQKAGQMAAHLRELGRRIDAAVAKQKAGQA